MRKAKPVSRCSYGSPDDIGIERPSPRPDEQRPIALDREGHLINAWGGLGSWPGALFGVHGIATDQDQNLYLAAVGRGGVQKFRPRQGANPAYLVGKPVYSAWK